MIRTFTLLITILLSSTAQADCLACWQLRKVNITLTSGDSLSGFVKWNDAWLGSDADYIKWQNKFPESLVYLYRSQPDTIKIEFVKSLFNIKNDSLYEFQATTLDNIISLNYYDIKTIVEIKDNINVFSGAGAIPIFTLDDINKLQTNPYAIVTINDMVADIYILSYNPEITRKQLNLITSKNYYYQIDELNKKGVITVIMSYD